MNALRITLRFVLAWLALLFSQMVCGMVIHTTTPTVPNIMGWLALSDTIIVLVMTALALRSDWRDWKLAPALFVIPEAIMTVNMIEGVFFLPNAHIDWRGAILLTLATYIVASVLWYLVFRGAPVLPSDADPVVPHRTPGGVISRVIACAALYVVLYYTAGMIIFHWVADFYATQRIPPFAQVVSMQFFLRGPVFVGLCVLMVRMFRLPRLAGALATGIGFTLISGVAPLVIPNGIFPDFVRWVHFCEVTSSNFVFGCLVAWVWGQAHPVRQLSPAHA